MPFSSKDFALTKSVLSVGDSIGLVQRDLLANFSKNFSGERQHGVAIVDLPAKSLSMTIGHLQPGQATRSHRHNYETLIYITQGSGHTIVGEEAVQWRRGDALYVPVWHWHHHVADADQEVVYVACENAPLLQNLGVALREES
jgi:gentisate 1,2-dioxygenase